MNNNAFTLRKLSIVLIIISLVVAGITGGKALIHASELNSIITDVNGFQTAFNNYQMQYDALPGDHRNAYDYFDGSGGSAVCGSNTEITTFNGAECNGNNMIATLGSVYESLRLWQHLNLAGFIPSSYTGVIDLVSPNVNAPASKIDGGGYFIMTFLFLLLSPLITGHTVMLGDNNITQDALLSPPDAQTIDKNG